jgi:hypothetical protein
MKRTLALALCILAFSFSKALADEPDNAKAIRQKIQHVDFEIALEHYKQVKMECLKTEMRLKLVDTEADLTETMRKEEHDRLTARTLVLRQMVDELRADLNVLGKKISVAAN